MQAQNDKCVMVLDQDLPLGILANTAGIMGITLGKHIPETVGPDVLDKSGKEHLGIIELPVYTGAPVASYSLKGEEPSAMSYISTRFCDGQRPPLPPSPTGVSFFILPQFCLSSFR